MRELATLRTLGASRRQVLGSVVLESVVIGLVGSIIGLFLGLAIAMGLTALLAATGVDLAERRTRLLDADDRRQPRRRHADRVACEPAAGVACNTGRADRCCPRGCGHARVALRALRPRHVGDRRHSRRSASSRYGVFADGLEIKVRIIALVAGVLLMFVGVAMIASRARASARLRARRSRRPLRRHRRASWPARTRSATRRGRPPRPPR